MTSLRDGRALRQQNIYDLNRERLINTAVQVINEVGDIREVTLTQIAKEAGVSPATAYNHFPERMEDVYSAIVHSKMDVAANMGATILDESLSPIEKIKQIPVTYAENLISLGYTGKVLITQMFNLIKVDKCIVSDVKTKEKNGYCAVQLSSIDKKSKNPKINKAQKKLFSAIDTLPKKIVKEFRVIEDNLLEIGTSIDISHYEKNQNN